MAPSPGGGLVLFGGIPALGGGNPGYWSVPTTDWVGGLPPPLNETWLWRSGTWVALSPAHHPPGLQGAAIAFDAAEDRTLLLGGWYSVSSANGTAGARAWLWNGDDWSEAPMP